MRLYVACGSGCKRSFVNYRIFAVIEGELDDYFVSSSLNLQRKCLAHSASVQLHKAILSLSDMCFIGICFHDQPRFPIFQSVLFAFFEVLNTAPVIVTVNPTGIQTNGCSSLSSGIMTEKLWVCTLPMVDPETELHLNGLSHIRIL